MLGFLTLFWYIFIMVSWTTFVAINLFGLPYWLNYIILLFGAIFYGLKLYFINNMKLTEINYWTLLFDSAILTIYVIVGVFVWKSAYFCWGISSVEKFIGLPPLENDFYEFIKVRLLGGALACTAFSINGGFNRIYKKFRFPNKVSVLEVFLVVSTALISVVVPKFTTVFIMSITYSCMPRPVKKFFNDIHKIFYKNSAGLFKDEVNNYEESDEYISSIKGFFLTIFMLTAAFIIIGLVVHSAFVVVLALQIVLMKILGI